MNKTFNILDLQVGLDHPPVIIAEMSGNHNKSLERAFQLVDSAAEAGAHILKLQTYTADTMTLNLSHGEFFLENEEMLWSGRSLYDIYQEAHTPWEWHAPIFARCKEKGILAFSTAFDTTSVDFLESLDVPAYKIASFENIDLTLIAKAAATGKPLIISTGMADEVEIQEAVTAARSAGCKHLVLLKCTSTYPADPKNSNIRAISTLQEKFGTQVGLSDHTMGIGVAVASIAFGATVIEKHFCLSRSEGGIDSAFSLEPSELTLLVQETERAWLSLGTNSLKLAPDAESRKYRRSIYIVKDLAKGSILTRENIRTIRPGLGLKPKHFESVLGKKLLIDAKIGTPLELRMIEDGD